MYLNFLIINRKGIYLGIKWQRHGILICFSNKSLPSVGKRWTGKKEYTQGTMPNICQLIYGLNKIELTSSNSLIFFVAMANVYHLIHLTGTPSSKRISKPLN